jgi:prepilin-type N-terminal cleavage/methylation domain-containing protein/prepilin-type processing-associated H-X9-DG protein
MLTYIRTNQRRGFTLVEVLVVIAIIGVLIGLLLPAVQQAREAARRTQCRNNLKQLGLALVQYHDSHGTFPAAFINNGPYGKTPYNFTHGWGPFVLPYIDQQPLYELYHWELPLYESLNQDVVARPLQIFQCPSAEQGRYATFGPFAMFNTTGACGDYAVTLGVDPALATLSLVDDGVGDYRGVIGGSPSRMAHIRDGSSNTILVTEDAGRPQLWQAGQAVAGKAQSIEGGPWAGFKNGILLQGAKPDGTAKFGTCAVNCTNDHEVYSFHPGGANAVFADGSVHFLGESINIRVLARMITRAGGEVASSGDY